MAHMERKQAAAVKLEPGPPGSTSSWARGWPVCRARWASSSPTSGTGTRPTRTVAWWPSAVRSAWAHGGRRADGGFLRRTEPGGSHRRCTSRHARLLVPTSWCSTSRRIPRRACCTWRTRPTGSSTGPHQSRSSAPSCRVSTSSRRYRGRRPAHAEPPAAHARRHGAPGHPLRARRAVGCRPQNQDRQGTARRTATRWRSLLPDAEVGLVMLPYGISALFIVVTSVMSAYVVGMAREDLTLRQRSGEVTVTVVEERLDPPQGRKARHSHYTLQRQDGTRVPGPEMETPSESHGRWGCARRRWATGARGASAGRRSRRSRTTEPRRMPNAPGGRPAGPCQLSGEVLPEHVHVEVAAEFFRVDPPPGSVLEVDQQHPRLELIGEGSRRVASAAERRATTCRCFSRPALTRRGGAARASPPRSRA
ncbi:hypothetical protein SUDANB15_04236 [Streptomyces sp. enrichment culture]